MPVIGVNAGNNEQNFSSQIILTVLRERVNQQAYVNGINSGKIHTFSSFKANRHEHKMNPNKKKTRQTFAETLTKR